MKIVARAASRLYVEPLLINGRELCLFTVLRRGRPIGHFVLDYGKFNTATAYLEHRRRQGRPLFPRAVSVRTAYRSEAARLGESMETMLARQEGAS